MAKKDSKNSKLTINDRMLIQACIAKGQPATSIAERIGFSVSTVYREIERGSRIRNRGAGKCPKVGRLGICNFCGKREDEKAILTITFPRFNLQIGRLIAKGDPSSAKRAIVAVMSKLIKAGFSDAFEVCLCDNGSEFASFYEVEDAAKRAGASKCRAFYARPYRSNDKAECERNHEFVRYVFPKGKSLDGLTQESVDSAFDNINSLVRAGEGNRTPSEAAERAFGEGFLKALGVRKIDKRKVRLTSLI